jgi:hypothetical protein
MGDMDYAEDGEGLTLLAGVREHLRRELGKLTDKRKDLEAQLEALGEELKGVDVEVEAMRRMLGLVEATEQQLAAQGQAGLHESGPDHSSVEASTEVRGRDITAGQSLSADARVCCSSLRQRLPSNDPDHVRLMPSLSRSPSPREPSPWPYGKTTCCHC